MNDVKGFVQLGILGKDAIDKVLKNSKLLVEKIKLIMQLLMEKSLKLHIK